MKWLISILVNWATLMIVAGFFAGFTIESASVAFLAALLFSVVNTFIKPILIFLTFPITVVTLGLFMLVINAAMLLLTATLIEGFTITSFWTAFWAGIIIGILNWVIQRVIVNRIT
ncbi:phage holin family protein [Caldalkalibacillus salinus]|uniref:phage holin family protein n=1 Tax=Caldalkalibacillus salinus TaxID=2803787 RepID=UPI00192258D8|nr:phage holin family protein [Caldalkalibacillus salinus]